MRVAGALFAVALFAVTLIASGASAGEAGSRHVPPDPPTLVMGDMSQRQMIELMQMDDTSAVGLVRFDHVEWRKGEGEAAFAWDVEGRYGGDYDKVVFKSEGEVPDGDVEARNELLWDRVFSRWWNLQTGIRHDTGEGPSRTWAAFGVQGLAPHWFEVEATAYVGEGGRTAFRLSAEYELLLTQRLVLQPEVEVDLYGSDDEDAGAGSGLSATELGVRLRYELRREFAPHIGVHWSRLYGDTADFVRNDGHDTNVVRFVVGLRFWF